MTSCQVNQIERVQKTLHYPGEKYSNYTQALSTLNVIRLSERRKELHAKCSVKSFGNNKYKNWFVPRNIDSDTIQIRSEKTDLIPVGARTKRYKNSPLPNQPPFDEIKVKNPATGTYHTYYIMWAQSVKIVLDQWIIDS